MIGGSRKKKTRIVKVSDILMNKDKSPINLEFGMRTVHNT